MNEYLSKKLRFFSFALIILVVLAHSQNISNRITGFQPATGFNYFIQTFVVAICQIAVPTYFIISGFLFFYGGAFSLQAFKQKNIKRLRTLVAPYLIASITGLFLIFLLQQPAATRAFFNSKLVAQYNVREFLDVIFLNPVPYQLWFLRNLIVVCFVLSPVIYFFTKNAGIVYGIAVMIIWFVFAKEVPYEILATITFFSVGAFIALKNVPLVEKLLTGRLTAAITICWVIVILAKMLLVQYGSISYKLLHNLSIITGIISFWGIYDQISSWQNVRSKTGISLMGCTFFIYLFHEPVLTIIIKLLFYLFHKTEITSFLAFGMAPCAVIAILYALAMMLQKISPALLAIITGNRK